MADWESGGKGALSGAAAGAGMGAVAGPWGAAIGGVAGGLIGGIGGLFGSGDDSKDAYRQQLAALANKLSTMSSPQSSGAATAGYSAYRPMQNDLLGQLRDRAMGYGPSAAEIQMRAAADRAAGMQASAAAGASQRGINAGAALRNATNQTAAIQAQGARDTATLRAQEQANYMGLWGTGTQQAISQDNLLNQFNAQQRNVMAQENLRAQLQALGITVPAQVNALTNAMTNAPANMQNQLVGGMATAAPTLAQWWQAQKAEKAKTGA